MLTQSMLYFGQSVYPVRKLQCLRLCSINDYVPLVSVNQFWCNIVFPLQMSSSWAEIPMVVVFSSLPELWRVSFAFPCEFCCHKSLLAKKMELWFPFSPDALTNVSRIGSMYVGLLETGIIVSIQLTCIITWKIVILSKFVSEVPQFLR